MSSSNTDLAQWVTCGFAAQAIGHKARQLAGRNGFSLSDRDDLEQELRLHLLRRLGSFDPQVAHWNVFVRTLLERHAATLVARAYYSVNHARLIRFCDVLKSGTATDYEDQPISLLWQFLVSSAPASRNRGVRRIRYAKTERALLAFLHGEHISCLRGMEGELFPLPEEVNAQAAA